MATLQQIAAVEKLVELRGTSVSRAMRESKLPYSPKTAKNPRNLTASKGFQEICEENGLTDAFLTKALFNDIKAKPKRREKELRLAFQIKQKLQSDDSKGNTYNQVNIYSDAQLRRIAARTSGANNGEPEGEAIPNRLPDSDES